MTRFSIGGKVNELVKVTMSQKQALTEQTDKNVKMIVTKKPRFLSR